MPTLPVFKTVNILLKVAMVSIAVAEGMVVVPINKALPVLVKLRIPVPVALVKVKLVEEVKVFVMVPVAVIKLGKYKLVET